MYPIHASSSKNHISKRFFSFLLTSHCISHLPVSFTCSPSCNILPSLWGWQSYICHVIKREMGGSIRGLEGGGGSGRTPLPAILASTMTCCDTREWPALHTRFISFTVGCQWLHSPRTPPKPPPSTATAPRYQTFSLEDEEGRVQLRNPHPPPHAHSPPFTHNGKNPVMPHFSVGPYPLLNLLPRGHNVTLILTTVSLHHIYSVPCC